MDCNLKSTRHKVFALCLVLLPLVGSAGGDLYGQDSGTRYDFLIGSWEGDLEYLDYGDDETRVTLPTWLVVGRASEGAGLEFSFQFEEPDGSTVEGGDRFYETAEGVYFGDPWQVESRQTPGSDGSYRLVLFRQGSDNERPASLWTTIEQAGEALMITKTVRYAGGDETFQRNQFRFQRMEK